MRIVSKRNGFNATAPEGPKSTDPGQRFIKRVHNTGGVIIFPNFSVDPTQK